MIIYEMSIYDMSMSMRMDDMKEMMLFTYMYGRYEGDDVNYVYTWMI